MDKPRRAAALAGLAWLKGHPERRLLVFARCHAMPPEAAAYAVATLDPKRKPPAGFAYLGTEDFRHGSTPELTRAETEPLVLLDGLHEPMGDDAVDAARAILEQRHHAGLPTIVSTCLTVEDIPRWLAHHHYPQLASLVGRLRDTPSALVLDCVTPRLPA
jgi:hypothetical protein